MDARIFLTLRCAVIELSTSPVANARITQSRLFACLKNKSGLLIKGRRYEISPYISSLAKSISCSNLYIDDLESSSVFEENIELVKNINESLDQIDVDRPAYLLISGFFGKKLLSDLFSCCVSKQFIDITIIVDHVDFNSIYDYLRDISANSDGIRFKQIDLDRNSLRMGQCYATLALDMSGGTQELSTIPANKNKLNNFYFPLSSPIYSYSDCLEICQQSFDKFKPNTDLKAQYILDALAREFPDAHASTYWHDSKLDFVDSFTWGHDHDFGFGYVRKGAMGQRHFEIAAEAMQYGYLSKNLSGKRVLDIGCWSGGDLLILLGLGAHVDVIEEHSLSAKSCSRLLELLDVKNVCISTDSLYKDKINLKQKYDLIYLSGVIYHVTDPLLAIRICFAYLKEGGKLIIETKSSYSDESEALYSGTAEKGWNWFSPSLLTLQRWFLDAGFTSDSIEVHMRPIGRLLGAATKLKSSNLPTRSGFSRPGSWLEDTV